MRVCYVDYAPKDQLRDVAACFLGTVLRHKLPTHAQWSQAAQHTRLAGTMVSVYEQLRAKFSRDARSHYLFTPRHLTQWALALLRYDLGPVEVLEAFSAAARLLFRNMLVGEDADKFAALFNAALRTDWNYAPGLCYIVVVFSVCFWVFMRFWMAVLNQMRLRRPSIL
jgi:dynein heavy chain 2